MRYHQSTPRRVVWDEFTALPLPPRGQAELFWRKHKGRLRPERPLQLSAPGPLSLLPRYVTYHMSSCGTCPVTFPPQSPLDLLAKATITRAMPFRNTWGGV